MFRRIASLANKRDLETLHTFSRAAVVLSDSDLLRPRQAPMVRPIGSMSASNLTRVVFVPPEGESGVYDFDQDPTTSNNKLTLAASEQTPNLDRETPLAERPADNSLLPLQTAIDIAEHLAAN